MWSEQKKCGLTLLGYFGRDICRVDDSSGLEKYRGTYEQCVQWLRDRNAM